MRDYDFFDLLEYQEMMDVLFGTVLTLDEVEAIHEELLAEGISDE